MVKENYCNCLWRVSKPAQPEVNDRSLACFNDSSFGSLIPGSSSPQEIVQTRYSALKKLTFFFLHKMHWIFVLCFPRKKEQDMPFLIQLFPLCFTKTQILIKKTPLWRPWGCVSASPEPISGPWTNLPDLQSQQFARLSPPSLPYFEFCKRPSPQGPGPS